MSVGHRRRGGRGLPRCPGPRTFGLTGYDTDISMNPIIDIFFFHYTINLHESYSPWFSIGFVFMLIALLWAAWHELKRTEES